jgi:8-oxo-dGTP pyrophosphatase MutT (NUDIX family)
MARISKNFAPAEAGASQRQCAALCWRTGAGGTEVLLVTSRETGRWVIPKGWPVTGLTGAGAAAREAYEEAGVEGRIGETALGSYGYDKVMDRAGPDRTALPCSVSVYPMQVSRTQDRFPECEQRLRKWFLQREASLLVAEPDLRQLIAGFDPAG